MEIVEGAEEEVPRNRVAAALETIGQNVGVPDNLHENLGMVAELLKNAPMAFLPPALIYHRSGRVEAVSISEKLSCGRATDCTICFPEFREISRSHFSITREDDIFWLEDHNSYNGTKIRGHRVQRHELRDGDIIDAAGLVFAFIRK